MPCEMGGVNEKKYIETVWTCQDKGGRQIKTIINFYNQKDIINMSVMIQTTHDMERKSETICRGNIQRWSKKNRKNNKSLQISKNILPTLELKLPGRTKYYR